MQRISAGTGVRHSEFNHTPDQLTHFLQIWIEPNETGIAPSYEQKTILESVKRGKLVCIASPEGGADAVKIHADAAVYAVYSMEMSWPTCRSIRSVKLMFILSEVD